MTTPGGGRVLVFNLVVLVVLYTLVIANAAIYRIHMRRHLPGESSRYPVSALTRSFRYLMPLFYLGILADVPLALFVFPAGPVRPVNLVVCLFLGVCSLLLMAWSLSALGQDFAPCYEGRLPGRIVRQGPYRILGHPIYVSNLIMLLGFNIALFNRPLFVLTLLVGLFYACSIVEEERALAQLERKQEESHE